MLWEDLNNYKKVVSGNIFRLTAAVNATQLLWS